MPDMSSLRLKGPWELPEVEAFLAETVIPMRLSTVTASGWPVVLSLWFIYENGKLHCASRPSARIVELLRGEPRCGFEVARDTPPYFGVRGQGHATLNQENGERLLPRLIERYLGGGDSKLRDGLLANAADEVCIEIEPARIMSWDFRDRMSD